MEENELFDCGHDWWELDFIQDGSGLACSDCNKVWELIVDDQVNLEVLPDAIQTIWQSSKQAIAELKVKYQEIELILQQKLGLELCDVCEHWFSKEEIVTLAGHKICPDDGGNMIDHLYDDVRAEYYEDIHNWFNELSYYGPDPKKRWMFEKQLISCPGLIDLLIEPDLDSNITLTPEMMLYLGSEIESYTLEDLAIVVSKKLSLDLPSTRLGKAWLLGILQESLNIRQPEKPDFDVCDYVNPLDPAARAALAIDIAAQAMPEGTEFSVELADSLLEAITHRCFESISRGE
jgi:hypothetical protein